MLADSKLLEEVQKRKRRQAPEPVKPAPVERPKLMGALQRHGCDDVAHPSSSTHTWTASHRRAANDPTQADLRFAGSGKTQILVHRAAYLRGKYSILDDRFKIFILTNVLRDYIRSGLVTLNLPDHSACTFDSWCVAYYQKHLSRRLPWTAEEESLTS
jgi:hypothetical protein